MKNDLNPTITLAQLYESQNQIKEAIDIYKRLLKISPDDEIKEKIASLSELLLEKVGGDYSEIIRKIFSREELQYFRVIPKEIETETISEEEEEDPDFVLNKNIKEEEYVSPAEMNFDESVTSEFNLNKEEEDKEQSRSIIEDNEIHAKNTSEIEKTLKKPEDIINEMSQDLTNQNSISDMTQEESVREDQQDYESSIDDDLADDNLEGGAAISIYPEFQRDQQEDIDEQQDDCLNSESPIIEEISSELNDIIKMRDELLEEKKFLLSKAEEIENKLSKLDIEDLKRKLAKLEKLNEEKRDQD